MQHNTDKEKATVRQKTPRQNPNMKTDTQTDKQKAQEHFRDRQSVVSGKFLLSKPWSQIRCEELQQWYENACAGRDAAKAQADKLAEALRDLRSRVVAERPNCMNTTKADDALAEYEAAK